MNYLAYLAFMLKSFTKLLNSYVMESYLHSYKINSNYEHGMSCDTSQFTFYEDGDSDFEI